MWMKHGESLTIVGFEAAIADYRSKNPDAEVELSNEAWVEAILAPDSNVNPQFSNSVRQISELGEGKYVDQHQNAVKLIKDENGTIRVISAGKDGAFDTEDDVSTDDLPGFMQKAMKQQR